jgi:beta-carotene 3-hydroxylase
MLTFILLTILGFVGLEVFSYIVHRWFFHGFLWKIHVTHHTPRKGWFELNDLFSIIFGSTSMICLISGNWFAFPIGLGIAIYGFVYFIAHDLFTHRRFIPFGSKNKILLTIRAAHQRHHQSSEKPGLEPFGLFLFNYGEFWRKISNKKT